MTLNHIRDGNVLSTSPPLLLHIGEGDRQGFWAGLPVYAAGLPHETVEDRRRNLLGAVQGVFQVGAMIDAILAGVKTPVRLYLFAPNAAVDDPPIYSTSRLGTGSIDYTPIFAAAAATKHIHHAFVEQEEFQGPIIQALKVDAEYMKRHGASLGLAEQRMLPGNHIMHQ